MTLPERSLADAERREFQVFANVLVHLKEGKDRANQYFFAPNATLNDIWRAEQATLSKSGSLPVTRPMQSCRHRSVFFYNPGRQGVAAHSGGWAAPVSVCGHHVRFEAMQRIVALQVAIHSQHLTGGADRHVDRARRGLELSDPYTGAPVQWGAASNALTFAVAADRHKALVPWPL